MFIVPIVLFVGLFSVTKIATSCYDMGGRYQ